MEVLRLQDDKIPKIFISYSWSRDTLVMDLANRLVSHGVDVVLDKWDLKEGNDKYEFMERCVNDPSITKVLIICDKANKSKIDNNEINEITKEKALMVTNEGVVVAFSEIGCSYRFKAC